MNFLSNRNALVLMLVIGVLVFLGFFFAAVSPDTKDPDSGDLADVSPTVDGTNSDVHFLNSKNCALCHSNSDNAKRNRNLSTTGHFTTWVMKSV